MKNNIDRSDRLKGALYGFAIGDAMGATTEFMTGPEIRQKYCIVSDIIGGGWLDLKAGQVTDDTQMMMIVADAYIYANGEEDVFMEMCCKGFADWHNSSPVDVGMCCNKIITKCKNFLDYGHWLEEADALNTKRQSIGNGSVMRCLFPALKGDKQCAITQGLLTHNNGEATRCIKEYCKCIEALLNAKDIEKCSLMQPDGLAINSVNNAKYWTNINESFETAIISAVNHGGDADTIAALAGGLAGAKWGFRNIPQRWIEQLDESVKKRLNIICRYL